MNWDPAFRLLIRMALPNIPKEKRAKFIRECFKGRQEAGLSQKRPKTPPAEEVSILDFLMINQREAARLVPEGWANTRRIFALIKEAQERGIEMDEMSEEAREEMDRLSSHPKTLEYQRVKEDLRRSNPAGDLLSLTVLPTTEGGG